MLGGLGGGPYAATPFVPKGQRTMVVVGGFPQDGRREDIERAIKTLCKDIPGLRDSYPVGRRPQIFKMEFGESRAMWNWLKSMKGRKLEWEGRRLWHTIEKSQEERLMSKKVGFLLDKLRTALGISPEEAKTRLPDPNYDQGIIYVANQDAGTGVSRVFQVPRFGKNFEVVQDGWDLLSLSREDPAQNPLSWVAEANQLSL